LEELVEPLPQQLQKLHCTITQPMRLHLRLTSLNHIHDVAIMTVLTLLLWIETAYEWDGFCGRRGQEKKVTKLYYSNI
jgi:hypothetical protein